MLENLNQWQDKVGLDHRVDLRRASGCDVGDRPAGFLAQCLLGAVEEVGDGVEATGVDNGLGLGVSASHNVAHGAKGRGLNRGRRVKKQLHEALGHTRLDHSLDLVVVTIGEIGDGPAGIGQDLLVSRVEENSESGKSPAHQGPVRGRVLATAEVGQSPGGVPHHRGLVLRLLEELEKGREGTTGQDKVAALWAITSNVTEGPDGLLADIGHGAEKEVNKVWDGTGPDDNLGLLRRARGDIGEGPGSLELERRGVVVGKELDELGDNTGRNHLFDRGVALLGEQLPELGGGHNLLLKGSASDASNHLWEVLKALEEE